VSDEPVSSVGWRAAEFVVVDLETTGLDPSRDEIIAFAGIPIRAGRVVPGELVATLIRPQLPPPAEGIRIHGLRESDLREQPTLDEQLDLIWSSLSGRVLVAHCAWIERSFLDAALARVNRSVPRPIIDTMALGTAVLTSDGTPCPDSPSLSFLARSLNLPVHRPHHADGDALTTAQVFLALASRLKRPGEATVGELASVRTPSRRALLQGARERLSRLRGE
jgi:DNA polymerase III subunit epsilon